MSFLTTAWLLDKYGPRLNIEQMAEVLGVAEQTVRNRISAGTLGVPTYRDLGQTWAAVEHVAEYFERGRQQASARFQAA